MLSLDLRQICRKKMPFFVRQKVQISSKILPQMPNSEFRQFRQISSEINIFVTTASFGHVVSSSSKK